MEELLGLPSSDKKPVAVKPKKEKVEDDVPSEWPDAAKGASVEVEDDDELERELADLGVN
jgi:hypothetical protein